LKEKKIILPAVNFFIFLVINPESGSGSVFSL